MASRNRSKSAYYFYMKETQKNEAAAGCKVTMSRLADSLHPKWANMSLVERAPYEEMARRYKNDPNLRGGKLASDGTRVEDNLREIEEREQQENMMKTAIRRYLNIGSIPEQDFKSFAMKKMFYFISFNILCHTETEYIPIEVGLVEYSVLHGIHRVYHQILYPGGIPTGYAGDAKRIREDKHGLEIFGPEENSERDMGLVFNRIRRFVHSSDSSDFPPLFSIDKDIELTRGCLEWLASSTGIPNEFVVWNSKYLLMELLAGAASALPSQTVAGDLLMKPSFDYTPAARCDFHDHVDNPHCALSYSNCLCYLLSDAVSLVFEVKLTEKHIPSQYMENSGYFITTYNNPSRTKRAAAASTSVRLDQRKNYYQNEVVEKKHYAEAPPPVSAPLRNLPPNVPRQPATDCVAAQMAKLKLDMTAAKVPGLGIGRGQRRKL